MWNIAVGDRVVCVKDNWTCATKLQNVPRKGEEYTVRGFVNEGDDIGILLVEVVNEVYEWGEIGFVLAGFKRVYINDISVFERLLENLPVEEFIKEDV